MVAGCVITEECALAASADRVWKVAFAGGDRAAAALPRACAGFVDAVEVDGDGGPGSVTTLRLNPAVEGATVMRSRLVSRDAAARVMRTEVLEGGEVSGKLRSQVAEVSLVAAGDGGGASCVAKVRVEYERLDGGGELSPEDQAKLAGGYLGLLKMVEAYLVAHPDEFT